MAIAFFKKLQLENAEVGCIKQSPVWNVETILPSRVTNYGLTEVFNLFEVFQDGFGKK